MTMCHTIYGQLNINLEDSICGVPKKQIQEVMSYSNKMPLIGFALNSMCLEKQNINNDQCLKDQHKLIECLQKECFLAKGNRIIYCTN